MIKIKKNRENKMNRAGGLQVPQIIVSQDRQFQRIPSIKISIEGASSDSSTDDDDDNETETKTRLRPRPNTLRCWQ